MKSHIQAPVLIVGYNRADLILELINQVVALNRSTYIWIDGAKSKNDFAAIETQKVIREHVENIRTVDINLQVNPNNLGCGKSLPLAVDWVLSKHSRIIVLEDDIRFTSEFFNYMDWALEKFEANQEIFHINGWTPLSGSDTEILRFYKSRQVFGWGWATWVNRWKKKDLQLKSYAKEVPIRSLPTLLNYRLNTTFERHWKTKMERCLEGLDAWDYQWQYSIWLNGGKSISPTSSFTFNIGFDDRATHTKTPPANLKRQLLKTVFNPQEILEIEKGSQISKLEAEIDLISYQLESKYSILYYLRRFKRLFSTIPRLLGRS